MSDTKPLHSIIAGIIFLSYLIFFIDIPLKVASKFFANRFSCGASVTGDDEIVIQGDVKDTLFDVLPEKWPIVSSSFVLCGT